MLLFICLALNRHSHQLPSILYSCNYAYLCVINTNTCCYYMYACINETYWLRAYMARDLSKAVLWSFAIAFVSQCCGQFFLAAVFVVVTAAGAFLLQNKMRREFILWILTFSIMTNDKILSNHHAKQIHWLNSTDYQYHLLKVIPCAQKMTY